MAQADNKVSDDSGIDKRNQSASNDLGEVVVTASRIKPPRQIDSEAANRRSFNPLRNYSSVTYIVSLYALPPKALADFNRMGKWDTSKMELLIQTGGINPEKGQVRNRFFNYDFTIDDLEIHTLINTKETQYASNAIDFKFKVYEPYSMTFVTRLAEVQKQLSAELGLQIEQPTKALAAPLLLVVKFYGYDKDGNIVNTSGTTSAPLATNSGNGAFERAFPIFINKLTFKLENRTTVYDINAKSVNMQTAFGLKRGIIDGDTDINAETVEDAVKQLLETFNKKQQELSSGPNRKQEIPDEYSYKILSPLIAEAFVTDQGEVKSRTGMLPVKSSVDSNVKNSAKSYPVNRAKRNIHFASGTPILKALDAIIAQSTFIGDSLVVIDEEADPAQEGDKTAYTNPNPKQLYWYNITPQVIMKEQHDNIRNDYAYKVEYIIQPYRIPYVKTVSANNFTSYPGPHKEYNYFYTGENTEIINYEQQYNLLYYLAASSTTDAPIKNNDPAVSSAAKPVTGASPLAKESNKNEVVGNIMTFLYSPGDQIKAQIRILGDPDYLMPSIATPSIITEADRFYGPDFTINPNSGQVFIEIEFNQVEDYGSIPDGRLGREKINDGLLNPNGDIQFWDYPRDVKSLAQNKVIYIVTQVISKFSRGTFTQDLKTILPSFPSLNSSPNKVDTQREVTASATARPITSAEFQRTDKDTRPVPLPGKLLSGKPNLAPASPDDPGQRRLVDIVNNEGRPVLFNPNDVDPRTLLPRRR
jgi:hypothetical protein